MGSSEIPQRLDENGFPSEVVRREGIRKGLRDELVVCENLRIA